MLITFVIIMLTLGACGHDEPDPVVNDGVKRTVLIYMVATNNLGYGNYDSMDLEEMQTAVDAGALRGGRLLVYHADYKKQPKLLEVLPESDPKELKIYDAGTSSLDPDRFAEVFADMRSFAPNEDYGLVLWSHGTGWVEQETSPITLSLPEQRQDPVPQSFGNEYGEEMSIPALHSVLKEQNFSWIYFDACHMGSIEVVYELRDVTPVIVGSGTELQVYGMRYDRNIPEFFADSPDMVKAARNTYEYYNSDQAKFQACTISVIDTRKLDALADATRRIMETGAMPAEDYVPYPYMKSRATLFDMGLYINSLDVTPSLLTEWNRAYSDAVVYHAATEYYGSLPTADYTGLGCYIATDAASTYYRGYRNLAWWNDVVSANPVLK